jgi:Mitochondrial carrier protein
MQMQMQPYVNSWQCAKYLLGDGGLASLDLYKGHVVNTIREAVFVASYFFVYEGMRELLIHRQPTNGHHRRAEETTATKTMIPLLVAFSPHLAIPVSRCGRHCRHDELGGEFSTRLCPGRRTMSNRGGE